MIDDRSSAVTVGPRLTGGAGAMVAADSAVVVAAAGWSWRRPGGRGGSQWRRPMAAAVDPRASRQLSSKLR